jgi:uncharacterized protein with von Willebrand factor type A (vWA) domain
MERWRMDGQDAEGRSWQDLEADIQVDESESVAPGVGGGDGAESPEARTKPMAKAKPDGHVLAHSAFVDMLVRDANDDVPPFKRARAEAARQYAPGKTLADDIFNALWDPMPQEREITDQSCARNVPAIHAMLQTREYEQLHALTELDPFGAAIGAAGLTADLVAEILRQKEQEPPGAQPGQDQPQQPQDQHGQGGGLPGGGAQSQQSQQGQQQPGQGPGQGRQPQGGQSQQGQPGSQGQQPQQPSPAEGAALRSAARQAAARATQRVQEARAALEAFGGEDGGNGWGNGQSGVSAEGGDMKERARLAIKVSQDPRLQSIAKIAGRMKLIAARVQRSKADYEPSELVGVTRGADVSWVLSSELGLLADDDTELLFLARYVERSLIQYEIEGNAPKGKGPIIVWVDESGSMRGYESDWAAAVAMTLRRIAAKQRRDFIWGHFAYGRANILVDEYPRGQGTPNQVMRAALHFWDGGDTSYVEWMHESIRLIGGARYDKADVITITDGICGLPDETLLDWHQAKKERGFRSYTVMIGGEPEHESFLRTFSDDVVTLDTLSDGDGLDLPALSMVFNV